jgi:hypothetical protein
MTGIEAEDSGRVSGYETGQFLRLLTIRPVGNVYIMLLLSGARHSIIWVLFAQILGQSEYLFTLYFGDWIHK